MESTITIKATEKAMRKFFDNNDVCSVRYFEANGDGTFKARIRHAEISKPLGVYTLPEIKAILKKEIEAIERDN